MNVRVRRHKPLDSFIEQPKFRPEVQGLRSLAVLLVVTYHVWFGKVSGGVDVFLFISAFLLSLSSLRKIQSGKPLKVFSYWLHVFQRLLPAAATVILATLVASYFIIAPSRWASLLADAKAALFYFLNWRLAFNAVDYYAQDATLKTPFQHFWSLSMQGQIFILWPILFAFVAFLVGYLRLKVLPTALLVFGSVFVASLTFSVIETYSNQSFAYFDTRTRLWEFAAGTLLAMLLLAWRVPRSLRVVMGWAGVIGLVTCGWLLPVQQAFPGYLALWPLLSGAFVIAAGQTGSRFGADRLLSSAPLQKMGAISYCLYLVHWPLLILYTTYVGEEHAGWVDGALVILVSIGLAWLLHNGVEKPLRAWEKKPRHRVIPQDTPWAIAKTQATSRVWFRPIAVIAMCITLAGGAITAGQIWAQYYYNQQLALAETAGSDNFPGARALEESYTPYRYQPIPSVDLMSQYDGGANACSGAFAPINPGLESFCTYEQYGDTDAPLTMIVGASHSGQAVAMWREVAKETQTNFIDMHLGGCYFPIDTDNDPQCDFLNSALTEEILDVAPDTVLVVATYTNGFDNQEILQLGLEEQVETLTDAGINVVALRDNPRYNYDVYECAQLNQSDARSCGAPVTDKVAAVNPALSLSAGSSRVYQADLTEYYCPNGYCEAVIGNIYVYMDNNHISRAYGKTLGPYLLKQLQIQGWDPSSPNPGSE